MLQNHNSKGLQSYRTTSKNRMSIHVVQQRPLPVTRIFICRLLYMQIYSITQFCYHCDNINWLTIYTHSQSISTGTEWWQTYYHFQCKMPARKNKQKTIRPKKQERKGIAYWKLLANAVFLIQNGKPWIETCTSHLLLILFFIITVFYVMFLIQNFFTNWLEEIEEASMTKVRRLHKKCNSWTGNSVHYLSINLWFLILT